MTSRVCPWAGGSSLARRGLPGSGRRGAGCFGTTWGTGKDKTLRGTSRITKDRGETKFLKEHPGSSHKPPSLQSWDPSKCRTAPKTLKRSSALRGFLQC